MLDSVSESSIEHTRAQVAALAALVRGVGELPAGQLAAAGRRLEALELDEERRERLAAELLEMAVARAGRGAAGGDGRLLGQPLDDERGLRLALERSYRAQARHAGEAARRIALVDRANRARPRTWL